MLVRPDAAQVVRSRRLQVQSVRADELTRADRVLDGALTPGAVRVGRRPWLGFARRISMTDLLYLALIGALFLLSIGMIRAFDRM
jgi:hypothetical protein